MGNANILHGVVQRVVDGKALIRLCDGEALVDTENNSFEAGDPVTVAVRSENIQVDEDCGCGLYATVIEKTFSGGLLRMVLQARDGTKLMASRYGIDARANVGDEICFRWESDHAVFVDVDDSKRGMRQ